VRDFVTLTFDCLTLNSCLTWRVTLSTTPSSLKTLRLFVHELRVITVPIDYHWKCVRGYCACAESRDPWVRGQKQLRFRNTRPWFAYSLYNFYWAPTTIKGRPMLKPFSGEKNRSSVEMGLKNGVFLENGGVQTLDIGFATPKEHFLARIPRRTASFDVFWVKIGARVSAVAFLKNPPPKNSRVTLCRGARNHVCAKSKPPKSIWIKFCLVVDITDVVTYINLVTIGWGVFEWRGGSNFPISHRLWSSPLQHSRATVRVCDRFILHFVHRFITCMGLHMSQNTYKHNNYLHILSAYCASYMLVSPCLRRSLTSPYQPLHDFLVDLCIQW